MKTTRRAKSKRWTVAAMLVAGCFEVYFWVNRRPNLDAVPVLGPQAITLVPGVHLLGALEPSAAYVVETTAGLVLVDSGLESDAGLVKSQLDKLGLDASKIRAILLTHVHGDHCGGAEIIRSKTGAKVYAGKGDVPFLRAGSPREAFFSVFAMPGHTPHPTNVDVELSDGGILDFGDARFKVIATPGHTEGSTCYLLEKSGLRILFGGDVITMLAGDGNPHSTGRKPLGTYSAYLAPRYHGDAEKSLASLRELRTLPVPDLVLPGHPRSDPTPQSPRLSQKRWETILDQGISDMETLIARYKRDGRPFLDGIPKSILPGLDYLGDFQGKAVYVLTVNMKRFLINAPGGPGLLDWINERSKALGTVAPADIFAILLTACGSEETEGLKTLVEATRAKVVASGSGVETVKAFVTVHGLPQSVQGW